MNCTTRIAALEKQAAEEKDRGKYFALLAAIRRERLREHVGEPVKLKRLPDNHRELYGITGTLLEVKRTWCRIDYGNHGIKRARIIDVQATASGEGDQ